eukprot:scaffold97199_cov48-Phaeocystis_antarctica.AAC.1
MKASHRVLHDVQTSRTGVPPLSSKTEPLSPRASPLSSKSSGAGGGTVPLGDFDIDASRGSSGTRGAAPAGAATAVTRPGTHLLGNGRGGAGAVLRGRGAVGADQLHSPGAVGASAGDLGAGDLGGAISRGKARGGALRLIQHGADACCGDGDGGGDGGGGGRELSGASGRAIGGALRRARRARQARGGEGGARRQ